ncbi:MAG: hypothetical protein H6Q69_1124 [Firmicutes bacterium]|nr:hypothetical protein [Bacillota bacterium]
MNLNHIVWNDFRYDFNRVSRLGGIHVLEFKAATATLSNNNLQERIQAVEKYDASSYYDIAKMDAKG